MSYLQELCPTPSTSNSIPSDPHSRQSSRAYSEMVPPPFRPIKETRSSSDTGLLDQVTESTGKDKHGKRNFFKKLIPKKFSSDKIDKISSAPDVFNKSYPSGGLLLLFVCLSVCLFVCLLFCLFVCLLFCFLFFCLFVCSFVYYSNICLSYYSIQQQESLLMSVHRNSPISSV